MINLKQNKGITLVTLILAIIIMLIISSVILYNASTGINTRALNNMYNDITILKDKVDIYYSQYGTLPIIKTLYTNVENVKNININDNENYYVVDIESLENVTLTYGKEYKEYKQTIDNQKTDLYIINEQSHTIYYVKGIKLDNKNYYTIPNEYTKIEIPQVSRLKLKQKNNNIATLEIDATNKNIGIKTINLYKENDIYKTYEYTNSVKERKQEIVDIELLFYEESNWYIQIIDTSGNATTSGTITLKNEDTISTKEDLFALAEVVNSGNTLEGKLIKQINDIDLNNEIWTPIGNYEQNENYYFAGQYDGRGYTISGLNINQNISYKALFGKNTGTIQNVILKEEAEYENSIIEICSVNTGVISNCTDNSKKEMQNSEEVQDNEEMQNNKVTQD